MDLDHDPMLTNRTGNPTAPIVLCPGLLNSVGYCSADRRYVNADRIAVVWDLC